MAGLQGSKMCAVCEVRKHYTYFQRHYKTGKPLSVCKACASKRMQAGRQEAARSRRTKGPSLMASPVAREVTLDLRPPRPKRRKARRARRARPNPGAASISVLIELAIRALSNGDLNANRRDWIIETLELARKVATGGEFA